MVYTRLLALAIGIISTFFLINAYVAISDERNDGFGGLVAIILIFFHLGLLVISIVILFFITEDNLVRTFYYAQSIVNFLLMGLIIITLPTPSTAGILFLTSLTFGEFLPIGVIKLTSS